MLYIPLSRLSSGEVAIHKAALTVSDFDYRTGEATRIKCYDTSVRGYLGVPRAYGLKLADTQAYVDATVYPNTDKYDYRFSLIRNAIQPRDDAQRVFMQKLLAACTANTHVDVLANADTGTGKTVTALWLAAQLGVPTLVTVPRERLLEQWLGSVREKNGMRYFFGTDFVNKHVGIIRQDVCNYRNKLICVAMAPSLSSRKYAEEFYDYFGLVIHDEVHMLSAPCASSVFMQFPASKILGLTATNKKGARARISDLYLGSPKVVSKQSSLTPIVYRYEYTEHRGSAFYHEAAATRWLVSNPKRNRMLANLIYNKGYKRGRHVLVLSDDVKQLQILYDMFRNAGVPVNELGLYVGEVYRTHNGKFTSKKEKVSKHEYDRIAKEARIIFATYGIFSVGVDIKRLDMGVEASPRSDLVQAIGRVIRAMDNKPQPEWYTITDMIYLPTKSFEPPKLYAKWVNQARKRIDSYKKQKANIINVRVSHDNKETSFKKKDS